MADELPFGVQQGFDAIEDNYFITTTDEGEIPELTDLDEVGNSTARKLNNAGIRGPKDLYGLSQEEIAAVNGIGPQTAAKIRQQVSQTGVRTRKRGFRDDDIAKAREYHADRTPEERRTDESFNAEIALNYDTWRENPASYDMPGVDTIPRERRLDRTKSAAKNLSKSNLVEDVEATASGPKGSGISGTATGGTARVKTAQDDPESTLAHELGHLADKAGGGRANITTQVFGGIGGEAETDRQERLREEGAKLASRRRKGGTLKEDWIIDRAEDRNFGGGGFDEVFADAFAEMVEEPRRAKKEAPELYNEIQDTFREEKEGFQTPF